MNCSESEITRVVEALATAIAGAHAAEGAPSVTASVGAAIFPADGAGIDALMSPADAATYRVKRAHRESRAAAAA